MRPRLLRGLVENNSSIMSMTRGYTDWDRVPTLAFESFVAAGCREIEMRMVVTNSLLEPKSLEKRKHVWLRSSPRSVKETSCYDYSIEAPNEKRTTLTLNA